jgi:hypothetical protein
VKFWNRILRLYSLAFHTLFVLAVLAMVLIILLSRPSTVNFYLLPWEGGALIYGLIVLAAIGAAVLLFAWRGKLNGAFLAWSIVVWALIVRYYFFSPYQFTPDGGGVLLALGLILASLLAAVGAGMTGKRYPG